MIGKLMCAAAASMVSPAAARQALNDGIDLSRLSTSPGVHIVPLDQSAFSGRAAEAIRQEIAAQAANGSVTSPTGHVPELRASTVTAAGRRGGRRGSVSDRHYRSVQEARPHLMFAPASVAGTSLDSSALREVSPAGGLHKGRWSGVTRAWDVAGLGLVQLDESEFLRTGGSITLIKESLKTEVSGYPATVKTMRDPSGRALVSVAWVTETTAYRLDLDPLDPAAIASNQQALLALANGIGR